MPDVKMRYPAQLIHHKNSVEHFANQFAHIVANLLDCEDYDGEPLKMTADQIDVDMTSYDPRDAGKRFRNAKLLIEITGYDYPDRMANIERRLTKMKEHIGAIMGIPNYQTYIAVTFIPIRRGCWA